MTQTLFLNSGLLNYTMPYLLPLLPQKHSLHAAFITTGADLEKDKWFVIKARAQLQDAGIRLTEIDLKEEIADSLYKKLLGLDAIYVNGGNTFYLLDWVRKSGFNNVLPKLLNRGMLYIGSSAGSIITCPTIEVAGWKGIDRNTVGLTDLTGLSLVPFYLFAHYEEKYRQIIEENVSFLKKPLIALTDHQAVIFRNGNYTIVGEGEPLVFNF